MTGKKEVLMGDCFMKSRALLKVGVCVAVLLVPMQLFAVQGPHDISQTLHNFGATGQGAFSALSTHDGGTEEVCVFCHTPHNASSELPLWNRYSSSGGGRTWLMYTSSVTLGTTVKANTGLSTNSPSRLCLSCHDGTTAINALVNTSATGGNVPTMSDPLMNSFYDGVADEIYTEGAGPYLGTNLVNMHPINFSYNLAQQEDTAGLYPINNVKADLKFFDDDNNGEADYLECATCHDPHVNYDWVKVEVDTGGDKRYRPFLRKPNISSGLCLTCHNK
jgi:hypothetical protein